MHRLIMGVTDPKIQVDHLDGNTLDNRKSNLKVTDNRGNSMNKRMQKRNRSGCNGIDQRMGGGNKRYRARYTIDGKEKNKTFSYWDSETQLDALAAAIVWRTLEDIKSGCDNGIRPKDFSPHGHILNEST